MPNHITSVHKGTNENNGWLVQSRDSKINEQLHALISSLDSSLCFYIKHISMGTKIDLCKGIGKATEYRKTTNVTTKSICIHIWPLTAYTTMYVYIENTKTPHI